ncbi:choice-of-anchor D domain-containing protein [Bacteroidota bacterium]
MKTIITVLALLFITSGISQTLIETIDLPSETFYNYGYGLVYENSKYWISSGSSSGVGDGLIKAVNNTGTEVDQIIFNYPVMKYSQGLAFDGINFWYVERRGSQFNLFKVAQDGTVLDSISTIQLFGASKYIGGGGWDGSGLWISLYYPNTEAALYKVDVASKSIIDTIPTFGDQPQGITVKGDTLFYVMDDNDGDDEKVFAVDMATKDTLFSFHVPDPSSQSPRGLAWDGTYFWLLAEPVGGSLNQRKLFKYDLGGVGNPGINIITENINFGNVQIDSSKSNFIAINNYGNTDLILDSALISNSVFELNVSFPYVISPGMTNNLEITFTPTENIVYIDSILFYHNDPNFEYSRVELEGKGVFTSAYLGLSQGVLNYQNKRKNSTSYIELSVSNLGSASLDIDSVTLDTPDYYLQHLTTPLTIDSLQSSSFRIWFHPNNYGSFDDTLTIYSNASNGIIRAVPVFGVGSPWDSTLGSILWQGEIPDNPGTTYNNYTPRSIKKIQDLNGDGIEDLMVSTENYWTIAYNGNSSGWDDILWKFSTHFGSINTGSVDWVQGLQIASDLNGDQFDDVVIGTGGGNEFVYALDGITGEIIWKFGDSVNTGNGDIMGLDVKRDRTGDGIPEVLVAASGNEYNGEGRFSVYMLNGATGEVEWQINQSAQQKLKYMVTSTDYGGAVGSRVGSDYEVFGFDPLGTINWTYNPPNTPWTVREIMNIGGGPSSDVIVGDIGGNVIALSGDTGSEIWTQFLGNVFIEDAIIVPDMNDSGFDDILVSGISSSVYLLEGSSGDYIWDANTGGNILGKGVVADMDGDGLPELGTASLNNLVHIWNGRSGDPVWNYSFGGGSSSFAAEHITGMDDIDNSNIFDFAACSRDGRVICFAGGEDIQVGILTEDLVPSYFSLEQNYPNPFNPSTKIEFKIPEAGLISLIVYDILGREVKILVDKEMNAGNYTVDFNAAGLASGIYFYTLNADEFISTKKMILLR